MAKINSPLTNIRPNNRFIPINIAATKPGMMRHGEQILSPPPSKQDINQPWVELLPFNLPVKFQPNLFTTPIIKGIRSAMMRLGAAIPSRRLNTAINSATNSALNSAEPIKLPINSASANRLTRFRIPATRETIQLGGQVIPPNLSIQRITKGIKQDMTLACVVIPSPLPNKGTEGQPTHMPITMSVNSSGPTTLIKQQNSKGEC
jgi:hypothetical protein